MLVKLALRNIWRNRWRSGLTISGVAVAVLILVWSMAMVDAWMGLMVRAATAVDTGQINIQEASYIDESNVYNAFASERAQLDALRELQGLKGATGRVHVYGLIGNEKRSQVVQLTGVNAEHEVQVTDLQKHIVQGEWLADQPPKQGPRPVVLGVGFAAQLDVAVGDELVVFLQAADGSLGNDLLVVRGLVKTGNTAVDKGRAFLHLEDLQWLAALEGKLHEVAIAIEDFDQLEASRQAVTQTLGPQADDDEALVVRTWQEALPQLASMVEVSQQSMWSLYFIIYLIAGLGILNAQRMSALERRREFGVLIAIGLSPRRLARVILMETVFIAALGALLGAFLATALIGYHAHYGLDLSLFGEAGEMAIMGVDFSEPIYFDLRASHFIQPIAVLFVVALLCGVWPALSAMRLHAIQAIAGRR